MEYDLKLALTIVTATFFVLIFCGVAAVVN